MKWLFRPALWIVLSLVLVGAAAVVVRPKSSLPGPASVGPGDAEIAWLYPATSSSTWERFVAAVQRSEARLQGDLPGLEVEAGDAAFPLQTAGVPQVAFKYPGGSKLFVRWYKVSGDRSADFWVRQLLERKPPPLAIIGGGTSYWARELAIQLRNAPGKIKGGLADEDRPVLVVTTATADRVVLPEEPSEGEDPYADLRAFQPGEDTQEKPYRRRLGLLYPGRTFRFAFTNSQMARTVSKFMLEREELRPDGEGVYMVQWLDDGYSRDLIDGYEKALFRLGEPIPLWIYSSIGSFTTPNPGEADAADDLLKRLRAAPRRGEGKEGNDRPMGRPLLVVSGQSQPSRRFLRALERTNSEKARRCVVATGDAISFNTIYRDRKVTWPIQDLPFTLVFFCHQNPVSAGAGFRPLSAQADGDTVEGPPESATGTEDMLLFGEIAEALALAWRQKGAPCNNAADLAARLAEARPRLAPAPAGTRLFGEGGQRTNGTGEHVVYLRPVFDGDSVLPESIIEVWAYRLREDGSHAWERRGEPITAFYGERLGQGGRAHGD